MNIEKEEEAFDFFSRLLRQLQQTERDQRECNINLVYVASGAQHVNTIQNQNNYCHEKKETKPEDYTDEEKLYPALMPQRAAMEAEVLLPPIDAEWYNNRFGTNLNKVNLSNWLNGTGETDYDPK